MVSGVVDSNDPNHPVEIYYSRPGLVDLGDISSDLGIRIYPEDKTSLFPDPNLGIGSQITIERALPIVVEDAGKVTIYRTWQEKVSDLLKENNIELMGQDTVEPTLESELSLDMRIIITRVEEVEIKLTEIIDYKTIRKEDPDLPRGQNRVETSGHKGEREVTYKIKRVNGEEVSRIKLSSETIKEPVNQVLIIGVGPTYASSGPYVDTINAAARRYLINGTALMCLMLRESGGSADAGYPDGMYKGLFQYEEGFWGDISAKAGYAGASIYDATAQIYTTAYALTHGYTGRWPPWRYCADK
jgi:hypothetical protein